MVEDIDKFFCYAVANVGVFVTRYPNTKILQVSAMEAGQRKQLVRLCEYGIRVLTIHFSLSALCVPVVWPDSATGHNIRPAEESRR